jgi:hypothetical protein
MENRELKPKVGLRFITQIKNNKYVFTQMYIILS